MKNKKNLVAGGMSIIVLCILMFSFCARATEVYFYQYVDSNTWTYATQATKQTTSTTAQVYVMDILKANGSSSNYVFVKAKATSGGEGSFIQKGSYRLVPIPAAYQSAGSNVSLFLMGANPALDCIAYGWWDVH